jgi:hypothetical protein
MTVSIRPRIHANSPYKPQTHSSWLEADLKFKANQLILSEKVQQGKLL